MIDLGEVKEISGLTLNWETAYALRYEILLSSDGQNWISVYETKEGDGKTDEIYFKTTPARFIKILNKKRATSWGYSLWEVIIKGKEDEPQIEASSYVDDKLPVNIMDGDLQTGWVSREDIPQWIEIDLRREKDFGGFQINWGKNYAKSYEIFTSKDGDNWQLVYKTTKSNGGRDLIYIDKTKARFVKVILQQSNVDGFSLEEFSLKGPDEFLTPERFYEVMANELPPGYFPNWIYKRQVYWTVIGVDEDEDETIISTNGTIEPKKGSFSIMPYIFLDGKLITAADCEVRQSLENGYLPVPSVEWNYQNLILRQKIFTSGSKGKSTTYVWYVLENTTPEIIKGKLYLSIRPIQLNPPWQYGGLSEIREIEFKDNKNKSLVKVNTKNALILLSKPDDFGALKFKEGDIISFLSEGRLPEAQIVEDNEGFASAAAEFAFELKPGTKRDIFFLLPLGDEINFKTFKFSTAKRKFRRALRQTIKLWKSQLKKIQLDIPQEELANVLKANLAYLLINRDNVALEPGPRNYSRSWIRDGAVMSASLLRTGHYKEVKEYLDWVSQSQLITGEIPCILESNGERPQWSRDWKEYDGQGAYIFAIAEYYRFTKDKEFLEDKFPNVLKALKFLEKLRKERLVDRYKNTVFYGILPESNSHEGYFPAQHSLWDDFWALKGWKEAQYIAQILGRSDLIDWMKKEEQGLRENLLKNIELVQKQKNIRYIPGSFEKGDFDATSTAISVWPTEEAGYLPEEDLMYTLNNYYRNTFSPRLKEGLKASYTPYEMRTATAYLMLGEKTKALNMLNYFLKDMRPREWKHWAEVVHDDYERPQYIGDMPHTWIGAIAINLIRSLFVYEREDSLVLGAGIDWRRVRENRLMVVKNLPTYFGKINYSIRQKESQLRIRVWGKAKPQKFIFELPPVGEIEKIKLNGKTLDAFNERISFERLPISIKIYLKK
jgi:hypothetical protein